MSKKHEIMREFVAFAGGQRQAAALLGVSRGLVGHICAGRRTTTPTLAEKAEQISGGKFRKEHFIWPEMADQGRD